MRFTLLMLLLMQGLAKGQTQIRTGPVTGTDVVSFRLNDVQTLEEANNAIVRLRVDSTSINAPYDTLIAPRKCSRQGSNFECEAYIPAGTVTKLNVPGKHELYSFQFNLGGESGPSQSWTITTPSK